MTRHPRPWEAPTREAALVLACARPTLTPARAAAIASALGGDLDWALVARLGLRHRIVPLLHRHLTTHAAVPEAVRAGLAAFAAANDRRAALLVAQLGLLLRRLTAAGVAVIALKGPALAQIADGAQGLRTISDLDLLITRHDRERAETVMRAAGFAVMSRSVQDDVYIRGIDGLVVEMHHRLEHEPGLRFRLAADVSPEQVRVGGQAVPVLPLVPNLLYLAHHGTKHQWSRLSWLSGFAGLLELAGAQVDWRTVHAAARASGIGRSFDLAVMLARDAFGCAVPAGSVHRAALLEPLAHDLLHASLTETCADMPTGTDAAAAALDHAARSLIGYVVEDGATVHGLVAIDARLCPVAPYQGWRLLVFIHRLRRGSLRHVLYATFVAAGPLSLPGPARRGAVARHAIRRPFVLAGRAIASLRRRGPR